MISNKFQIKNITHATSVNSIYKEFSFDFKNEYKNAIGVLLIVNAGAGTGIKLSIEDSSKIHLSFAPYEAYITSREINRKDTFIPVFIPANGNTAIVKLQALTITTALDFDVIFLMSNESCKNIDLLNLFEFQHSRYTIPSGTTTKYQTALLNTNVEFAKIKGIALVLDQDYKFRFAIKDSAGSIIVDQLHSELLRIDNSTTMGQSDKFFPINIEAKGQKIIFEYEPISTVSSDINVDVILLLEK